MSQRINYHSPATITYTSLTVTRAHATIWISMSVIAMSFGLWAGNTYNRTAGTKFTSDELVIMCIAMNTGPFVGPVMKGRLSEEFYTYLAAIAVPVFLIGWLPYALWRRSVHAAVRGIALAINIVAALVWFGAAMVSLGFFLH